MSDRLSYIVDRVEYWREKLEQEKSEPLLIGLEALWRHQINLIEYAPPPDDQYLQDLFPNSETVNSRNEQWSYLNLKAEFGGGRTFRGATIFQAISFYLNMGMYPPPELLLVLQELFGEYLAAEGEKTLDDIFLSRAVPKLGNLASRRAQIVEDMALEWVLRRAGDEGKSQINAVSEYLNQREMDVDPESYLRAWRRRVAARDLRNSGYDENVSLEAVICSTKGAPKDI